MDNNVLESLPDQIVDAHHHLWNPVTQIPDIGYVWLSNIGALKPFGDPTPIQRDYLFDEFVTEQDIRPLAASVHLQADGAIADPVAETRFIQSISDAHDFPIAIVGFVDLTRHDAARTIATHRVSRNFRGVRQILSRLDDRPEISFTPVHFLRNPVWQENFQLLEDNGLSFDLQLYPEQMEEAADFLAEFPGVPVIVDHAGSPYDQTVPGLRRWKAGVSALAKLPNIHAKICGLGMFDRNWNAQSINPITDTLLDLFGPQRLMFASNFPVDKLMRSYPDTLVDIALNFCDLPVAEIGAIFRDNARRIYRI